LQICDRFEQPFTVPQRNAHLLKIGFGQLGEDIDVNFILAERSLILTKPVVSEPSPDIDGRVRACHGSRL
jgi:hypothetical protein